jgi:hypothetical protein
MRQEAKMIALPAVARAKMTPKGISLRREVHTLAGEPILIHLWCVPKGYSMFFKDNFPEQAKKPITVEQISAGEVLERSPFYLDAFVKDEKTKNWQFASRATFETIGDAHEIQTRWLRVKEKKGPVFLLSFGMTHWMEWQVVTFPKGIRGAAFAQRFLYGGEGDSYVIQAFNKADAKGFLQVDEEGNDEGGGGKIQAIYHWNGSRYVDEKAVYFLLGVTTRSKATAEAARDKEGNDAEVIFTSDYPKLTPGYYAVLIERFQDKKTAEEIAAVRNKEDKKASLYVRKAK